MILIELISDGDHAFIKPIISRFISANQEDCRPFRIKSIENPYRIAFTLYPQFAHMLKFRAKYARGIWKGKTHTPFLQKTDNRSYLLLLLSLQTVKPSSKLICVFYFPHVFIIYYKKVIFKRFQFPISKTRHYAVSRTQ